MSVQVPPDSLHFTRGHDGLPQTVPCVLPEGLPCPPLRKGDRGEAVQLLQFALIGCRLMRYYYSLTLYCFSLAGSLYPSRVPFTATNCPVAASNTTATAAAAATPSSSSNPSAPTTFPLCSPSTIRFHAGIFGRHTVASVAALQALHDLLPTGV